MRRKIVAGNWKMNMNLQDGVALAKELNETLKVEKLRCGVVICTLFIHLASIASFLDQEIIELGAENCADKESGAYTGEVSTEMVRSTGAHYVIIGHSERREYYHETPEILKEKVRLALKQDLKVIFCIGESLAEREAGRQNEVVKAELEGSVFDLTAEDFAKIIIAYEPMLYGMKSKIKTRIKTILTCIVMLFISYLSFIYIQGRDQSDKKVDYVIVLGARLFGEDLSLTLYNRLNTALDYLEKNKSTKVIVSGGQGYGEDIPEAALPICRQIGRAHV